MNSFPARARALGLLGARADFLLGRICNPPALSISICNAKNIFYRIINPYIQSGWIANPAGRDLPWGSAGDLARPVRAFADDAG